MLIVVTTTLLPACSAIAGDYLATPRTANEPTTAEVLIDPTAYACLAWPIRAGTNGERGEHELNWLAGHPLNPTPLPAGYVPVGGIVLDGNAAVVACLAPRKPAEGR